MSKSIHFVAWHKQGGVDTQLRAEREGSNWFVTNANGKTSILPTIEYQIRNGEPWYAAWSGDKFVIENGAHGDRKVVSAFEYRDWNGHVQQVEWDAAKNEFMIKRLL